GVVHVHVVVHHHDVFGEHHLAHAAEPVHDFVGLHWVGLADAHEDEVVEGVFGRQRDIIDIRYLGQKIADNEPPQKQISLNHRSSGTRQPFVSNSEDSPETVPAQ